MMKKLNWDVSFSLKDVNYFKFNSPY